MFPFTQESPSPESTPGNNSAWWPSPSPGLWTQEEGTPTPLPAINSDSESRHSSSDSESDSTWVFPSSSDSSRAPSPEPLPIVPEENKRESQSSFLSPASQESQVLPWGPARLVSPPARVVALPSLEAHKRPIRIDDEEPGEPRMDEPGEEAPVLEARAAALDSESEAGRSSWAQKMVERPWRWRMQTKPDMVARQGQQEVIRQLADRYLGDEEPRGAVVCMDPGTGKTLTALHFMRWVWGFQHECGLFPTWRPWLVVCPLAVVSMWTRETRRVLSLQGEGGEEADVDVVVLGEAEETIVPASFGPRDRPVLFVCTFGAARSLLVRGADTPARRVLGAVRLGGLILDESHKAKGEDSQCTRALGTLRVEGPRVALSGTALINDPLEDLQGHLVALGYPGEAPSTAAEAKELIRRMFVLFQNDAGLPPLRRAVQWVTLDPWTAKVVDERGWSKDLRPLFHPLAAARALSLPYLSQRYSDAYRRRVLDTVACWACSTKTQNRMVCGHHGCPSHGGAGSSPCGWCQDMLGAPGDKIEHEGRTLLLTAKLKATLTFIHERLARGDGSKVLVLSENKAPLDLLEFCLEHQGIVFCRVDGETRRRRDAILRAFDSCCRRGEAERKEDEGIPDSARQARVLLATTGAAGVGVSTRDCTGIIAIHLPWAFEHARQWAARAWRVGQAWEVEMRLLAACAPPGHPRTYEEEEVWHILQRKQQAFESVGLGRERWPEM